MNFKQRLMNSTILMLGLTMGSLTAVAGDYTYIKRYVPVTIEECHAYAQSLTERFAEITGITPFAAGCQKEFDGIVINLRYSAAQKIESVSTGAPAHSLGAELGTYKTLEDCQANLVNEASRLTQQTGHEIFTSYCYQQRYASSYPWIAIVESLGTTAPTRRLYGNEISLYGKVLYPDAREIGQKLVAAFTAQDATLRSAILRPSMTTGHITMTYFHNNHLKMRNQFFSAAPSSELCQIEGEVAESAFAAAEVPLIINLCTERFTTRQVELQVASLGERDLPSYATTDRWSSHEACAAARGEVIQRLRAAGRDRLVTVLCDYRNKVWQALAIEK